MGSKFHDTLAVIYPAGPKKTSLSTVKLSALNANPTLSNEQVHVTSQADQKISNLENVFSFSPADTRFDQVQVFYYLQESLKWFSQNFDFKLPFQIHAEVHIGYPEKTNAAFYYSGKIRLGAEDDETYKNIPHDPSIVIHESVHAVIDTLSGLPFDGEGGSINEGIADFMTALQLNTPHMAEASYLKGSYRRTIANLIKLQDKNGGTYHDSAIISGLLWELSKKWDKNKTQDLTIYILNRLTPASDFTDFNQILLDVLKEFFNNPEDNSVIQPILINRGFQWY